MGETSKNADSLKLSSLLIKSNADYKHVICMEDMCFFSPCLFGVHFSSHLLITNKREDQNISLALLLSEPDFSREIYIFPSFSVKVSSPVFSPKEL